MAVEVRDLVLIVSRSDEMVRADVSTLMHQQTSTAKFRKTDAVQLAARF